MGFDPTTFRLLARRDIHCATDLIWWYSVEAIKVVYGLSSTRGRSIRMYFTVYYIVLKIRNNLQWFIAKWFRYCIIVLRSKTPSNDLSDLTGPRGSMYIDIIMDIVYL